MTQINCNLFCIYFPCLEEQDSEKEDANQKEGSMSTVDGNYCFFAKVIHVHK